MNRNCRGGRRFAAALVCAAMLFLGPAARLPAAPPVMAAAPAPPEHAHVTFESEHFRISYDPKRVTPEQAHRARDEAERAWGRCARQFEPTRRVLGWPEGKVELHLCWDGWVFSAVANQGPPPRIQMRYADLEYLGITGDYLFTHEVAHIFSGHRLAGMQGGALTEGIAEYVAGPLFRVPLGQWMGTVLREQGYWFDPEGFFITGEYESPAEPDARSMTALYAEQALFVQFLVREFGWERFVRFAVPYRKARFIHFNNDALRRADRSFWIPRAKRVRAAFEEHLGVPWEEVRRRWERAMARDRVAPEMAERGRLILRVTEAATGYELWMAANARKTPSPDGRRHLQIRDAIGAANRAANAGQAREVERALDLVRALAPELRRPQREKTDR